MGAAKALSGKARYRLPNHIAREWFADQKFRLRNGWKRPVSGDNDYFLSRISSPQLDHELIGGHIGKVEIEENKVKITSSAKLQRCSGRSSDFHLMSVQTQQLCDGIGDYCLIIHHQDAFGPCLTHT